MLVEYAGKLVHLLGAAGVTLIVGGFLLAWRDRERVDMPDQLVVVFDVCVGVLFGVLWELAAFLMDWALGTDLQQSNADTMTDFLWNDVGAVVAAVLVVRLYCHALSSVQREALGQKAAWLVDGPSRTLDRHGALITIGIAAVGALAALSVWLVGRQAFLP